MDDNTPDLEDKKRTSMDEDEDFISIHPMDRGGYVHIFRIGPHQCVLLYRNIYRAYNETPTKRKPLMKTEQKKMLLKAAFGLGTSLLIGKLIKLERQIEDRINERIDEKYPEDELIVEN